MMIAIWLITVFSLVLWSLGCWGLHAVLTIGPGGIDQVKPLIERIPYGERIDEWIPGWQTVLQFVLDTTQVWLVSLSGAAPWLAWALWAIGCVVMLMLAGIVSLAVVLIRNEMKASTPSQPALPSAPR